VALNYNRLRYFWVVAREGTLRRASEYLHVSEPAISVQLKKLQGWMREPLFRKQGRRLVLTELGQVVYQYSQEIFALGEELTDVVRGRSEGESIRMRVGLTETIPKALATKLLAPAFDLGTFQLEVREAALEELVAELALHELELVLSDRPVAEDPSIRIFAHSLGQCDVTVLGTRDLAATVAEPIEKGIGTAPWLLPAEGSPMRGDLERWFAVREIRPNVVAEFQDSALLKAFAAHGRGLIAVPSAVEREVCDQFGLVALLRLPDVEERFFALTSERKISHPGIGAILSDGARSTFLPSLSASQDDAGNGA
jgi:LysR family transcriptional activator of nhaA